MTRLRQAGHRQAFQTTGSGIKAEAFHLSQGWQPTGTTVHGQTVFRLWL
jgi:hypothetical protein